MALKQIKNKIASTKKTGQVTKAMEAVSAVKMRKTQEQALSARPYVRIALRILERIAASREGLSHPLMQSRKEGVQLLVVVTSDKGLAGSVNSSVLKLAEEQLHAHPDAHMIALGRKAVEFAERRGIPLVGSYTNIRDDVAVADVYEIAQAALAGFGEKTYSDVSVIYQNFLSTFEQRPALRQLLPLDPAVVAEVLSDIRPKTGKFSDEVIDTGGAHTYTIEPSAEDVLDALIPHLLEIVLYHALIESKACEHSARMVAMKNATDKAKEVTRSLTLAYNKERQSVITAEVSEITGGIEALKT